MNNAIKKCWFCNKYDKKDKIEFSWEFDTFFHMSCLEEELERNPKNREAKIIAREFGIK